MSVAGITDVDVIYRKLKKHIYQRTSFNTSASMKTFSFNSYVDFFSVGHGNLTRLVMNR